MHAEDQRHVEFLRGADLVVHDAPYTVDEYAKKAGWGHTPAEWAIDYAIAAGAKRLALFHHDPHRDDEAVDHLVEVCRQRVAAAGSRLDVFAAAEGLEVHLGERDARSAGVAGPPPTAMKSGPHTILVADDDPTEVEIPRGEKSRNE